MAANIQERAKRPIPASNGKDLGAGYVCRHILTTLGNLRSRSEKLPCLCEDFISLAGENCRVHIEAGIEIEHMVLHAANN